MFILNFYLCLFLRRNFRSLFLIMDKGHETVSTGLAKVQFGKTSGSYSQGLMVKVGTQHNFRCALK